MESIFYLTLRGLTITTVALNFIIAKVLPEGLTAQLLILLKMV
ncbi:hypothetical protein BAZSYMB_SCAFFOLD00028_11 [Bathymodiolus azoricus thioautotrophic gill symbiont]|uniref:Uncharacterized protein n=1 Tax=Bathymodiolus azoricus thioautotrophic gill symbiont TaxID=235205 RepID=A0A1H6KSM9_9GAMM|nr:hypothetical protein BAZSYMB_SCAFFOLD00028_11 [Bathymodiolus azoricus thioautotrophic gill symbiont]